MVTLASIARSGRAQRACRGQLTRWPTMSHAPGRRRTCVRAPPSAVGAARVTKVRASVCVTRTSWATPASGLRCVPSARPAAATASELDAHRLTPRVPPQCPGEEAPCNGHGECLSMRELGHRLDSSKEVGTVLSSARLDASLSYDLWDADMMCVVPRAPTSPPIHQPPPPRVGSPSYGCACDEGYSGYDCSERMCPRGDDPLSGGSSQTSEQQIITCNGVAR